MKNTDRNNAGFTLVELLTSMAVSALILGLLAITLGAAYNWSDSLQKNTGTRYDLKVALDYFNRDFSTIGVTELGRSTFTVVPETVSDEDGNTAQSVWIQMLCRPASLTDSGSIRTVSYRLVNTDPLTPQGDIPRFALYRSEVTPSFGEENVFLSSENNLHDDFWNERWPVYSNEDSGRILLDDFLAENVVKVELWLNYFEADAPDVLKRTLVNDLDANEPVNLTPEGWLDPAGTLVSPNIPVSITLSLTSVSKSALVLMDDGVASRDWDQFLLENGVSLSRTFPFSIR